MKYAMVLAAMLATSSALADERAEFDKVLDVVLQQSVEQLAESLPQRIDSMTTIDSAMYMSATNTLIYNATINLEDFTLTSGTRPEITKILNDFSQKSLCDILEVMYDNMLNSLPVNAPEGTKDLIFDVAYSLNVKYNYTFPGGLVSTSSKGVDCIK